MSPRQSIRWMAVSYFSKNLNLKGATLLKLILKSLTNISKYKQYVIKKA